MTNQIVKIKFFTGITMFVSLMSIFFISNISAAIPMTHATRKTVEAYINAGMGAASIVALLGGGGLVFYIVKKAFQTKAKNVILAA